jgi:hypothetical protein
MPAMAATVTRATIRRRIEWLEVEEGLAPWQRMPAARPLMPVTPAGVRKGIAVLLEAGAFYIPPGGTWPMAWSRAECGGRVRAESALRLRARLMETFGATNADFEPDYEALARGGGPALAYETPQQEGQPTDAREE